MRLPLRSSVTLTLVALFGTAILAGQQAKPTLAPADYGKWESLGAPTLSPDGRWVAYPLSRVDEKNELRLMSLERDTAQVRARGATPFLVTSYATSPAFSADSRWAAWLVGVSAEEREKAEQARKPVRNRLGLLELGTGKTVTVERVAAFRFSPNGRYLAIRGYPAEGKTAADLIVRDLGSGSMTSFGNVTEFAWADTGATVAMTVETEGAAGNGIQLYHPASGVHRVLESGEARYRGLAWRKKSDDLAVLRTATTAGFRDTTHAVLAWSNVRAPNAVKRVLEPDAAGIPAGQRISETPELEWSDDGAMIAFGLRLREAAPDTSKTASKDKLSDVQVWHGADRRIIPMQKAQERTDLRRALLAVWRPATGAVVRIGTDLLGQASLLHGWRYAFERSDTRYPEESMFGRTRYDVDLVNVATGERQRVLERIRYVMGGSPTGRYLLYYRGGQYWTLDVATGAHTNITARLPANFADTTWDTPTDELPPAGFQQVWARDDRWVLLQDNYDIWQVKPDGSGGQRLTEGAADRVTSRVEILDRSEPGVDPAIPVWMSLTGERTKQSGYARIRPGRPAERLVLEDSRDGRLMRADSAEVFLYQRERFDDSPDLFVAGADLGDARAVTTTNAFQGEYAWGRAELVDYVTSAGKDLQGALYYPAGYVAGRTYPMIVNPYEIQSVSLHRYWVPTEQNYYNVQVWTQQGYFVLLPDIVFRAREPGPATVEALEAAVAAVLAKGAVDPKRVGLVGHSWGGYEATYVPTRSRILEAHLRSSPAAKVNELQTPMLMEFGDADGTVDWHQGVEFYNFARRAGKKDFVLLVYPGEDHGLRKKENQADYHRRILQWFGHWLKGEPAPVWMTEGVSWLERKRMLEDAAKK
ncbi:MAG: putative peptidase [Gemmatimonadetes bacterium]|nr:putative peptidase [Gemmatimonadota bacterium]